MENTRVYNIEKHYLVEIDDVQPFGSNGTATATWSWDVYIASKDEEYKGMAIARERKEVIHWTALREEDYLSEIIKLCQNRVAQRSSF
ncbi:hypothetical protein OJ967_25380 [Peribacillus frigoritolerans]|uniref:hypothetical protein n=1 Tax=Peribacillus frigoritolerans TaxID=450367 RepID=UPI00222782F4|nr:hypothetical protein [Peribacillus frigoritolerans]UYY98645.1 hypothetical protein OJ967_25380 [Peribacillus frigoritolerans]